ncbi:MAG TPA: hypothetical protein VKU60_15355, partial [Chloroflexota bacterium]|nr:hypothetical protein [Chloroflexota bacterium]
MRVPTDSHTYIIGDTPAPAPAVQGLLTLAGQGASRGLTALSKLAGGKRINVEPFVRLLGMRIFARRMYGALIDANGASYADVDETLARIRSLKPEAWAREWRRTAERFDQLGREAATHGRSMTAVELLVKASNYYRFAEMSLLVDTPERETLQQASVDAYVLAGQFMDPPLERVCLPVDGHETPAYVRVPRGIERPPIVLIVPGLGMVKEHGDFPQEVVLDR